MNITIIETAYLADFKAQIEAKMKTVDGFSVKYGKLDIDTIADEVDVLIIPITKSSLAEITNQTWDWCKRKHQANQLQVLIVLLEETSWHYRPYSQVFPTFPKNNTVTAQSLQVTIDEIFNYLTADNNQSEPTNSKVEEVDVTNNTAAQKVEKISLSHQQFLAKAKAATAKKDYQKAIDYYNKILTETTDESLSQTCSASVEKLKQTILLNNWIEKGRKAYQQGNLESALAAFKEAAAVEESDRVRKTINRLESTIRKKKIEEKENREKRVKWLAVLGTIAFAIGIILTIQYLKRPKPIEVIENISKDSYPMILVKGGTFEMGANAFEDQRPSHKVTLDSYYIGKYEVTVELYDAYCAEQDMEFVKLGMSNVRGKTAMTNVSWYEACQFANWLSKKAGYSAAYIFVGEEVIIDKKSNGFRLPTEAQWEFAAIGGRRVKKYIYSGGNYLNDVAWNADNSKGKVHQIGQRKANDLGIHDMSGNVWEWCWDWYREGYYHHDAVNPEGKKYGYYKVMRGGSWYSEDFYLRPRSRMHDAPSTKDVDLGFRLVRPN